MKILAIDDDKLNLSIVENYLTKFFPNVEVMTSLSPEEGLEILFNNNIDILLLDIVMPKMSGIELLKEVRSKDSLKDLQIIMLTSMTDQKSFKECFDSGANDFIGKPFESTEFQARIKAALKTRDNHLMLKELYEHVKNQNVKLTKLNKQLKDTQGSMIRQEKMASIGELATGVAQEINIPVANLSNAFDSMEKFVSKVKTFMIESKKLVYDLEDKEISLSLISDLANLDQFLNLDTSFSSMNELLEESREEISKVSKITKSLRNFAKIGVETEFNYVDINEIIEESLLILRNEMKNGIELDLNLGKLPDVYCSKGQIAQTIVNILINAVQALNSIEKPSKSISVTTLREDSSIILTIKDNGPGIPKNLIDRVFDPFFTTKDSIGTGLGLSIAYETIVTKHKGDIEIDTDPLEGTSFVITLPIHQPI